MGHTPYDVLQEKLEKAKEKVVVGGTYYHWKHPESHYTLIDVGYTEWDEGIVVIYKQNDTEMTWVRKLEGEDGWLEPVEEREGDDKSRFVLVEESTSI